MRLTARKYKHSIQLILISSVEDEFGKGKITSTTDVLSTFADVIQTNSIKTRVENTNAQQEHYRFTMRYTDVVFNAVRWRGINYIVSGITNVNESNAEIVVNAQRAE